ncbi:hypothetical protein [Qipengyuania nanhaisediminis]|uniref:hypothetical protein n=1 Tax=Qipengyuania nanhaisediminis TaxID=604088 RepID=UPI0038B3F532
MADYKDPREEDIVYGDRRLSRPDASLPDWEMPDTAYRPLPIVWFTGAFFVHLLATSVIALILSGQAGWISFALSAMAAGGIARWTWARGMAQAATGWKIATIAMLLINLFFVAALSFPA